MTNNNLPVLLLTGYLGSGKTTLLNRILNNRKGIKFAVIVNDIGEVNIDADLIQKGGVVDKKDDSLVSLQNGCICCTLKMDLVQQLHDIIAMRKFDYIVIEASGICEPAPIAQTICAIPQMDKQFTKGGVPKLDCIATVVDALRMRDEFASGSKLTAQNIDEEDIENLVIQQIEFCNIILLNKSSEVSPEDLEHIRQIIHALQPKARIIPCDYGDINLNLLLNTGMFDFDKVATSAAWIAELESPHSEEDDDEEEEHHGHHNDEEDEDHHYHGHDHHDDDDDDEHYHGHDHHDDDDDDNYDNSHHHEHHHDDDHHHHDDDDHNHEEGHHHHHHHHHDHEGGEVEEYGIGTYVYYRRTPFDLSLFDDFVARKWPKDIIRAKGMCWFKDEPDICYVFEQAGRQFSLRNAGQWYATMPDDELEDFVMRNPEIMRDWDHQYGDRMQKLVFIGQHLDKAAIKALLDKC